MLNWEEFLIGVLAILMAAGFGLAAGIHSGSKELEERMLLQHTQLLTEQAQVAQLEKIKSLKPADVCPAWWFGHSAKDLNAVRKRMCGH